MKKNKKYFLMLIIFCAISASIVASISLWLKSNQEDFYQLTFDVTNPSNQTLNNIPLDILVPASSVLASSNGTIKRGRASRWSTSIETVGSKDAISFNLELSAEKYDVTKHGPITRRPRTTPKLPSWIEKYSVNNQQDDNDALKFDRQRLKPLFYNNEVLLQSFIDSIQHFMTLASKRNIVRLNFGLCDGEATLHYCFGLRTYSNNQWKQTGKHELVYYIQSYPDITRMERPRLITTRGLSISNFNLLSR